MNTEKAKQVGKSILNFTKKTVNNIAETSKSVAAHQDNYRYNKIKAIKEEEELLRHQYRLERSKAKILNLRKKNQPENPWSINF